MGVYVWDCLCSVDWGNKIQGQMSDFRVAENYASYYPLSTSEPLSIRLSALQACWWLFYLSIHSSF